MLASCSSSPAVRHRPYYYTFTLSKSCREHGPIKLLAIEPTGRVKATIYDTLYFAKSGEIFVNAYGYYSEYRLESVDQIHKQILIRGEGRLYY